MKTNLLWLIVIMTYSNCARKVEISNDSKEMSLYGKVKSINEISYTAAHKFGEIQKINRNYHTFYLFNNRGNLLELKNYNAGGLLTRKIIKNYELNNQIDSIIYSSNGTINSRVLTSLDKNKNITSIIKFYKDGERGNEHTFTYNNEGKLIEENIILANDKLLNNYSFLYDDRGNMIEKTSYLGNGDIQFKEKYFYDKNSNEVELRVYNSDGNLSSTRHLIYNDKNDLVEEYWVDSDSHVWGKETYDYSKSGYLTEKIEFNWDGIKNKAERYDDKGNIIEYIEYEPGEVDWTETYVYTFDKNDNWITKIIFENNIPKTVTEREILYFGQKVKKPSIILETIENFTISEISPFSCKPKAEIKINPEYKIISRGFIWGLNDNPTIEEYLDSKYLVNDTDEFSIKLLRLSQNTTYFIRAYATFKEGVSYSKTETFNTLKYIEKNESGVPDKLIKDIDGNTYKTIKIGDQVWMAENLNVSRFRNGSSIKEAKYPEEWENSAYNDKPAWCYFNDWSVAKKEFGKLYNYYAVIDPRGLCPIGWHVPSDDEWTELINYLGGDDIAGNKLRSLNGYNCENDFHTNISGFNGLPGEQRVSSGEFSLFGGANWWCTIDSIDNKNYYRNLSYWDGKIYRDHYISVGNGYHVRCLKD